MTAATLKRNENLLMTYPQPPEGYAGSVPSAVIWARIEDWIAYRWGPRAVVWVVHGPGDWQPDLEPASVTDMARWHDHEWQQTVLKPSALGGFELPGDGYYRMEAEVGSEDAPPEPVLEAFRRLGAYLDKDTDYAGIGTEPGATSVTHNIGDLSKTIERQPAWVAKAMHYSGAADLLRSYRRVV